MLQEIGFRDADFPHRFAWRNSRLEGKSLRWVPYGMPRLNTRFKHMAFFLYGKNPKTGKVVGPMGTGFFLGMEGHGSWYHRHIYAVTCFHVAVQKGASIIRINTKDGASRPIEFEPHEWQFISNGDDLCAVDVTDRLGDQDEYSIVPANWILDKEFIAHEQVDIGEDGFMLGLFADHAGKKQNLIAGRFGNLSLLAHESEPIEQPHGLTHPSHIFDMRSRPGFSGSPVFVYRTPDGDLRDAAERGRLKAFRQQRHADFEVVGGGDFAHVIDTSAFNRMAQESEITENTFLMLLGIHAGQYPERIEARKIKKTSGESDDIIRDRDGLKIPSSMAVVVPAWKIENLLKLEIFQAQRDQRDKRMIEERDKKNLPEPESTNGDSDPPANDANPTHQEDFNSLVGAAARKRPQGG